MVYVKLYMPFKKGQYVYNGLMFSALVLRNSSPKIITVCEWNYVITRDFFDLAKQEFIKVVKPNIAKIVNVLKELLAEMKK